MEGVPESNETASELVELNVFYPSYWPAGWDDQDTEVVAKFVREQLPEEYEMKKEYQPTEGAYAWALYGEFDR